MHRDDTAARQSCAPENYPTPPVTQPEPTQREGTIALRAIGNRKTAIVAAAVALAVLFYFLPTLTTGLVFGGALFAVNTLVDGKMGGRGDE